jgi:hypothetical protein
MQLAARLSAAVRLLLEGEPVREAAGAQVVDDDEHLYRRLSGDANRDLSPLTQARMIDTAAYLWESNLLANRLVELPVAYLLAEGLTVGADDEAADAAIRAHWRDPVNNWPLKSKKRLRELLLFGEACWPAFTAANGHVRLGYLDPAQIETVVTDPDNREIPVGIVTRRNGRHEQRRYRVIHNGLESDLFTARTQEIRATFADGECFFYRLNDLMRGTRGRSVLLAQADWLDAYDSFLFGEIDRAAFLRAFVWDVSIRNGTADQVKQRAREIKPPAPGSVNVHNDSETWEAKSPSLGAGDTETQARLLRNHVLGGSTTPEHWFGGAADVNRATGESMSEPTFKILSSLQGDFGAILEDVLTFVVNRSRFPAGDQLAIDPYNPDEALLPAVQWPELSARDTSRYAAALSQVVVGAQVAIDRGLISEQTALELIAAIAGRLGVEIDPAAELAQARVDASRRRREQAEGGLYEDDPAGADADADAEPAAAGGDA